MKVAWAAQIGVFDDRGRFGGILGGFVATDEGGDAFAGQATDLDGAGGDSFGLGMADGAIELQYAQACSEACSGCGRLERMAMISPAVCGPIDAPQRRNRSGVHSA